MHPSSACDAGNHGVGRSININAAPIDGGNSSSSSSEDADVIVDGPCVATGNSDGEQTTKSAAKRPARTPKSPATKARDKQRVREQAERREREREEYRIGDGGHSARDVHNDNPWALVFASAGAAAVPVPSPVPASPMPAAAAAADAIESSIYGDSPRPADLRLCPLPALAWAHATDVWRLMCRKDEKALLERNPAMLQQHPGIQPRMRAILLDWLMEVCEVYKLHRETYYLAVDYLDRYLSANKRLAKTRLQLIGITCLFTAAKVEEIYPPKISEFAYVTDGACSEEDIVKQELMLMLDLQWNINPVTIIGWLGMYMQLNCSNRTPAHLNRAVNSDAVRTDVTALGVTAASTVPTTTDAVPPAAQAPKCSAGADFVYPQFSALEFVLAARVLDLCTLDVEIAHFQYSVVAAAVLALTKNR